MATSRKILVVSALALASHFVALAVHSALASSIIEFVLIVLAATACFQTANRASGFARRFWRLMGIAFALYSAGQVLATYYDSVLHASLRGTEDINALYWWVFTWRNFILAFTFVLRAALTKSRLVKSLFGRMAIFLVLFGICDSVFVYAQTWQGLKFGTWYELLWTIPRMLMIWLATTWVPPKEPEPALKESSSESLLLAQFAHIAFPLLVLAMATTAISQQLKLAAVAVLASFRCSTVRLPLSPGAQSELLSQQKRAAGSL